MQTSDTPYTETFTPNENLIKANQEYNQQNSNINQYFVESEKKLARVNKISLKVSACQFYIYFFLLVFIMATTAIILAVDYLNLFGKISRIIHGVTFSLIILICFTNKIQITKDYSNNKIVIKILNYLCFPKKTIKIDTENFNFAFQKKSVYYEDTSRDKEYGILRIINNNKNIDLDISNIKQKPPIFLYSFDVETTVGSNIDLSLKNVAEISSSSDSNPLLFDINKYMNKDMRRYRFSIDLKYLKFSEHFFTFHIITPPTTSFFYQIMVVIDVVSNYVVIPPSLLLLAQSGKVYKLLGAFAFVIINLFIYIIYKLLRLCLRKKLRIDWMYSKDFDRIFIGIVDYYNKTSYTNSFEFEIKNIERFILENESNENYNLKVLFKNNEKQHICNIKKNSQQDLEGLAFLLNEKINKN